MSVSDQLYAYNEGLHGTIDVGNGRQARGSLRTSAECRMLCDLLIYERSWLDRLHRHSLFPTNVTTPISSTLLSSSCCFSSKFLVHYSYSLSFPFSLSFFFFHVLDTRHLRFGFPYHGVENYKNTVRDGEPFFSPSSSHDRLNSTGRRPTQRGGPGRCLYFVFVSFPSYSRY